MSDELFRTVSGRAEAVALRLGDIRSRTDDAARLLSSLADRLLASVERLDGRTLAALEAFDPAAHAEALGQAIEARMTIFVADFDRVLTKVQDLPARIAQAASGETLVTVQASLATLTTDITSQLEDTTAAVEATLVTEAYVGPAEALVEHFDDAAEILRDAVQETETRLETLAESLGQMASGIEEMIDSAGRALGESWESRAKIMDEALANHAANISSRISRLEDRFETVRDRLLAAFTALSALRRELTDLTAENTGPAETLAEVRSAASDTFAAVT